MTVTWEKFAGNTEIFAVRASFVSDPHGGHAATAEESSSWGALQLWVAGHNLCSHVDQGEILQSAHWYLLPLLEWVVASWNPLLHEERLPNINKADSAAASSSAWRYAPPLSDEVDSLVWEQASFDWWTRHALRSARSGGLVPNVFVRRFRDLVELSWDDEPATGTPPGFAYGATKGRELLAPEAVAVPLYEVVKTAVDHLASLPSAGNRIANLNARLGELEDPRQLTGRLGWLVGLTQDDPVTVAADRESGLTTTEQLQWTQVVQSFRDVGDERAVAAAVSVDATALVVSGSCHATLLFSSLSPTVTRSDVRTLARVLVEAYAAETTSGRLDSYAAEVWHGGRIPPWEQGYELAESLHDELQLDLQAGWVDIESLLHDLGVRSLVLGLGDPDIRACSMVGPHHVPTVVQNSSSSFYASRGARRFNLAHELCHLLYDRSRGQKLAIASGPWAPVEVERRANAFAAMFLMPTELVRQAIAFAPAPVSELDGLNAVATRLRTSRNATIDHLYNISLMGEATRDELRKQL